MALRADNLLTHIVNFQLQHDFAQDPELIFSHSPDPAYLAIIDLESYPPYVSESLDYFGMIEHLGRQMGMGHAVAWGCPESDLSIRIRFSTDYPDAEMKEPYCAAFHSWLETSGSLCFVSHDELYNSATTLDRRLNDGDSGPEAYRPRQLFLPDGIYCASVFRHFPWYEGDQEAPYLNDGVNYSVVLRQFRMPPECYRQQMKNHLPWI